MTPVPFDLPVRTGEAGALARVLYEHGNRPLTDDLRNRLAVRTAGLSLETIRPYFGSLERDPIHPEAFFLAVEGIDNVPLLMRFAPSTTPSSGLFPKAILIGRLRVGPQETVINATPFGAANRDQIRTFASQVNTAFQPKVQGSKSTLSAPVQPGVFEEFRAIYKPLSLNVACVSGDLETIVWEAIRSGWREGYSAETGALEIAGYSRYIVPNGPDLAARLELIARARVPLKLGRMFDWELQVDDATSPGDVEALVEECKAIGKPPQYLSFTSGALPGGEDWQALARRLLMSWSFSGFDDRLEALSEAVRGLGGRFNYRAGAGLNPQVLSPALFGYGERVL